MEKWEQSEKVLILIMGYKGKEIKTLNIFVGYLSKQFTLNKRQTLIPTITYIVSAEVEVGILMLNYFSDSCNSRR